MQLVLSDIVMPGGMTGYDVARWVTSNKPGIQIILCSGHHDEDPGSDVRTPIRDVIVLGKPYSREQLARALSNALALVQPEASSHSNCCERSSELASDKLH